MLDGGSAHITKRLLSEVDYTRRLGLHGIDVISRREDGKEW